MLIVNVVKGHDLEMVIPQTLEIDTKNYSVPIYIGFRYFSPIDKEDNDFEYLLAMEDEKIVGVLKLGTLKTDKTRYVSYVDVAESYREKGIARTLYRELNDVVRGEKLVVNSPLTGLGKKAKLDKILKQEVVSCKTKTLK